MPYTRVWTKSNPPGSQAANTVDDEIRNLREDVEQRMTDLVTGWSTASPTDPIVPKTARARLFRAASQSIPTAALTAVSWDSESYDTDAIHDLVTNPTRLTVPAGEGRGCYIISAQVTFAANGTGIREIRVRKNNVDMAINLESGPVAADAHYINIVTMDSNPTAGDFYEVFVRQTSGGALNIGGTRSTDYVEIVQVL